MSPCCCCCCCPCCCPNAAPAAKPRVILLPGRACWGAGSSGCCCWVRRSLVLAAGAPDPLLPFVPKRRARFLPSPGWLGWVGLDLDWGQMMPSQRQAHEVRGGFDLRTTDHPRRSRRRSSLSAKQQPTSIIQSRAAAARRAPLSSVRLGHDFDAWGRGAGTLVGGAPRGVAHTTRRSDESDTQIRSRVRAYLCA